MDDWNGDGKYNAFDRYIDMKLSSGSESYRSGGSFFRILRNIIRCIFESNSNAATSEDQKATKPARSKEWIEFQKKFRKKITVLFVIIVVCFVILVLFRSGELHAVDQAKREFRKTVIAPMIEDMREAGLNDIVAAEPTLKFSKATEGIYLLTNVEYQSGLVDTYFEEKYEGEGAKDLFLLLEKTAKIRDCYCDDYFYEYNGKTIKIRFVDHDDDLVVQSLHNSYILHNYDGDYWNLEKNWKTIFGTSDLKKEQMVNDSQDTPAVVDQPTSVTDIKRYWRVPTYGGKKKTKSSRSDDYNVYEYDDPEDFYEDWIDDFEDYEEAEDYYYDAWEE